MLYKTNTIHIANSVLFPRLPRLLIPERMADIVSLELVWDHHELRNNLWGNPRPAQMPQYLHVLSDHLSGLTKIFISVVRAIHPIHANLKQDVLKPLDDFVRSTPRLRELCISVPWWHFLNVIVAEVTPKPRGLSKTSSWEASTYPEDSTPPDDSTPPEDSTPLHVWRPLSDKHVAVEVTKSPYPDAPVGLPKHHEDGGLAGYWIMEGHHRNGVRDVLLDDPA